MLGFPPLREMAIVPLMGFLPLGDVNADIPRAFSQSYYGSQNPLMWDFPYSEFPTLLLGFSLSKLQFDAPLVKFLLLEIQTLAYGLSLSELTGR